PDVRAGMELDGQLSSRGIATGRAYDSSMRALRFYGPGDLRLEDVPKPEPAEGDVLVEIEVALTDGTDQKTFRRGHPRLLEALPSPFGHEFCGIDVATGRRVVAANSARCGHCPACRVGNTALCRNIEFLKCE